MIHVRWLAAVAASFAFALPAAAQVGQAPKGQLQSLDVATQAERQLKQALIGDIGLRALLPLTARSPLDTIYYADRVYVPQEETLAATGGAPQMFNGWIPPGAGGTGTTIGEIFKYQLGTRYSHQGQPHPMVIAYHGYGASPGSVDIQSTIDEECNTRGWIYLAPMGMDDQLFGTPLSQQNASAAVQFMLNNFNVDPDRLYMVGFSMGGGVIIDYVARHRDPAGIMIAALGIVSGTHDWAMTYTMATSQPLKDIMVHPFNFGGPPAQELFRYQQASSLHFDVASYPPTPGLLSQAFTMAANMGTTPRYLVWDVADTVTDVVQQMPLLDTYLSAFPADHHAHTVSGTPTTHSWAVLDEADLFDFFDGRVVDRTPAEFEALIDVTSQVSWAHLTQRSTGQFSSLSGVAEPSGDALRVDGIVNASELAIDFGAAGLAGAGPFELDATSADDFGVRLRLEGFPAPPAYLLDRLTGDLITGVASDPAADALLVDLGDHAVLEADVVLDPTWTTDLFSAPHPATLGANVSITLDAPAGLPSAWIVVGFSEALSTVKGFVIGVQLGGSTFLLPLALDPNGDILLSATIPNDPAYQGLKVKMQSLALDGSFAIQSVSNLWSLDIE